jgi:hypothetical protein
MGMDETSCDIHDVTRAASDLVAVGSRVGMAHIPDGFVRLRFGSIVSAYADEIIQAVDEGIISAWQAVQDITAEYESLSSKARFYVQNGVGFVAGVMQVRTGATILGAPVGLGAIPGALMVGHGVNNIYEGLGNIYRGPGTPSTVGPAKYFYRTIIDDEKGDMIYYSMDLFLSAVGVFRSVSKHDSVELFRHDPINYERAYHQVGRLALSFEVLVDAFTINSMLPE